MQHSIGNAMRVCGEVAVNVGDWRCHEGLHGHHEGGWASYQTQHGLNVLNDDGGDGYSEEDEGNWHWVAYAAVVTKEWTE